MTKPSFLYQSRMEEGECIYCGKLGEKRGDYRLSHCRRHRKAGYRGNATCPSCDYWGLYYDTPTVVRCAHCSYTRAGADAGEGRDA